MTNKRTGNGAGNPPFRKGAKGWATHICCTRVCQHPPSVAPHLLTGGGKLAGEGVEGEAAEEVAAEAALDLVEAA